MCLQHRFKLSIPYNIGDDGCHSLIDPDFCNTIDPTRCRRSPAFGKQIGRFILIRWGARFGPWLAGYSVPSLARVVTLAWHDCQRLCVKPWHLALKTYKKCTRVFAAFDQMNECCHQELPRLLATLGNHTTNCSLPQARGPMAAYCILFDPALWLFSFRIIIDHC